MQEPIKILDTKKIIYLSRLKRRLLKHFWLMRLLLLGFGILVFIALAIFGFKILKRTQFGQYITWAEDFIFLPSGKIAEVGGRTNILILGKGGAGHEAPDLTDTIIFASIFQNNKDIRLISLPRDIWIPALRAKLNSAYYWGNQKQAEGGLTLAKSTVEEIVGQPVSYAIVIDFSGFKKVIDDMGGIDVNVQTSFIDDKFPIPGREADYCNGDPKFACRYETIKFDMGLQHMNGETALKFVRSRNAKGDEGTDFARVGRQELVLQAIKTKALSRDVYLHPNIFKNLWNDFWAIVETDIPKDSIPVLGRLLFNAKNNVKSSVLPQELLINPPTLPLYDYLYVFIPKGGDWTRVQEWIVNTLDN